MTPIAEDIVERLTVRKLLMRILRGVDMLAKLDGWLGVACLFTLCSLMIAGIIVRSLANIVTWLPPDIPIAWEYSSYLMAISFTFGAAMTLRAGGHIRVRILLGNASPPVAWILELVASIIGFIFAAYFSYAMGHFAWRSFISDERSLASNTPLWIPQSMVAFGAILLTLQLIARLGHLFLNEQPEDKMIIY